MSDQFKNIRKLTAFMKKAGLISIKTADIELNLHPSALFPEPKSKTTDSDNTPIETPDAYTAEDVLYWSSPSYVSMEAGD